MAEEKEACSSLNYLIHCCSRSWLYCAGSVTCQIFRKSTEYEHSPKWITILSGWMSSPGLQKSTRVTVGKGKDCTRGRTGKRWERETEAEGEKHDPAYLGAGLWTVSWGLHNFTLHAVLIKWNLKVRIWMYHKLQQRPVISLALPMISGVLFWNPTPNMALDTGKSLL